MHAKSICLWGKTGNDRPPTLKSESRRRTIVSPQALRSRSCINKIDLACGKAKLFERGTKYQEEKQTNKKCVMYLMTLCSITVLVSKSTNPEITSNLTPLSPVPAVVEFQDRATKIDLSVDGVTLPQKIYPTGSLINYHLLFRFRINS